MKNFIKYSLFVAFVFIQVQLFAFISNSEISIINSEISLFKNKVTNIQDPELILNFDNVVWGLGNYNAVNVIANDKYINSNGLEEPIVLGNNATIATYGTWPVGFALDTSTGVITTTAVNKPDLPLQYTVCVNGMCKINSLTYQNQLDVLEVTKSGIPSSVKNGDQITYTVSVQNKTVGPVSVDFNEFFKINNNLLNNSQIQFVSWSFQVCSPDCASSTSFPVNLLAVDQNNKLTGTFNLPGNQTAKVSISVKIKTVLNTPLKSYSSAFVSTSSENVLANNEKESNIIVNFFNDDLSLDVTVENPNSTVENNIFTVRITNVGNNIVTSKNRNNISGNPTENPNIRVVLNLDNNTLSESITTVNEADYNDFVVDNSYSNPTIYLKNNVEIQPGGQKVFKFKKTGGFTTTTNQVFNHVFNLNFVSTNYTLLESNAENIDSNTSNNSVALTTKNSPIPGLISFVNGQNINIGYVCQNGTIKVYNNVAATSSVSGANLKYKYEISTDNGLNWITIKNGNRVLNTGTTYYSNIFDLSQDPNSSGIANSTDDVVLDSAGEIELRNITSDFLIRRYVFNNGQPSLNTKTPAIQVNNVENKISFPNGINTYSVPLGQSFILPSVTTTFSSTIKYYKINPTSSSSLEEITNPQNPIIFSIKGFQEYLVKATTVSSGGNNPLSLASLPDCDTYEYIRVYAYDLSDCVSFTKRTFATISKPWTSGIGGIDNPNQVIPSTPSNPQTLNRANAATIVSAVSLLGIGTLGVDLYFTKPDGTLYSGAELKGKKVVVKFGEQYSGLKLAGGVGVMGRLANSGQTATTITNASSAATFFSTYANTSGATFAVKGGLLDALKGDNVFEYSFTPAKTNGEFVEYNGIRIQMGSLLGVADLASVFYAYIEDDGKIINDSAIPVNANQLKQSDFCSNLAQPIIVSPPSSLQYPENQWDVTGERVKTGTDPLINNTNITLNPFIEDAFWGNYSEVLNVASGLSSVVYPYYGVDNDYDSYALFNATAGVLNQQFLQAELRQPARAGDQVQITLAYPNLNILNLSLLQLGNFKIVYFLNGAKVGEERLEDFRVLDLGLFRFGDKRRAVLSRPVNFMFDAIQLQQFNTVSVNLGDGLHIHDIRINPLRAFVGMTDPKEVTQICATEPLLIQKPDACTSYTISFARVTEYGGEYQNANGSPLLDYRGQPIKMIKAVSDIANSNLLPITSSNFGDYAAFDLNISKLFIGPNYDNKLLVKIQTTRQGCNYGDPQYLRIDLTNCETAIVNPVIKSSANY